MTGFRYLVASILLIAFATLVSANYRTYGSDATIAQLFSLGAICENGQFQKLVPFELNCEPVPKNEAPRAINFKNDDRVMR